MPPPLIELKSLSKTFRLESGADLKVLEGVDLAVHDGDVLALLGPSGSGKSTCLRIMSGLIQATSGETLRRGKPLEGVNPDIALVFQSFALFPWETVHTNIALALKPIAIAPTDMKDRVRRVIDLVGLEGFEEAYPRELSGGMKQRVGIARSSWNVPLCFSMNRSARWMCLRPTRCETKSWIFFKAARQRHVLF